MISLNALIKNVITQNFLIIQWRPIIRYRVDFENGYASYDSSEYYKALKLYEERGIRLRECKDLFDEGVVIMGAPIFEDLSGEIKQ